MAVQMVRKLLVVGFAVTVALAGSLLSGAGSLAGASATKGTGDLSCSGTGHINFRPPLTSANGTTVGAYFHFDASGCSGGTPEPSEVKADGRIARMESTICSTLGVVEGNVSFKAQYPHAHVAMSRMSEGDWAGASDDGSWDTAIEGSVTGSYSSDAAVIEADFSTSNETGSCTRGVRKLTFTATLEDF
ncbi:MAG: hypothetical protein WBG41_09030 [Acidimicrobiales bacterium]